MGFWINRIVGVEGFFSGSGESIVNLDLGWICVR